MKPQLTTVDLGQQGGADHLVAQVQAPKPAAPILERVKVTSLISDPRVQTRVKFSTLTAATYAQDMRDIRADGRDPAKEFPRSTSSAVPMVTSLLTASIEAMGPARPASRSFSPTSGRAAGWTRSNSQWVPISTGSR